MDEDNDKSYEFLKRQLEKYGFDLSMNPIEKIAIYETLKKQMKDLGFSYFFAGDLLQAMANNQLGFSCKYKEIRNEDILTVELNFKRSINGNYFFNDYALDITNRTFEAVRTKPLVVYVEYFDTLAKTFSLDESYNLLKGRWVCKQSGLSSDKPEYEWRRLDFYKTDESGNYELERLGRNVIYDLESVLMEYPIEDKNDPIKMQQLITSLKKGNREEVTFDIGHGIKTKLTIQANPPAQSLDIFLGHRTVYISQTGGLKIPGINMRDNKRKRVIPNYKNVNPFVREKMRKRLKR